MLEGEKLEDIEMDLVKETEGDVVEEKENAGEKENDVGKWLKTTPDGHKKSIFLLI